MNVYDPIYYWAKAAPHRAALAFPGGSVSYRQLCNAADAAAVAIARAGFSPKQLVNVSVINPAFQMILLLALGRLNGPAAFLKSPAKQALGLKVSGLISENPQDKRDFPRALIVDHNWFVSKLGAENPPRPDVAPVAASDLLRIAVSSGSTGTPKAVAITQGMMEARLRSSPFLPERRRTLCLLTPTASWGFLIVLKTLRTGGTFCFAPFPDDALALCESFRVEFVCVSVAQAASLVFEQRKLARELQSVDEMLIGGSTLAPAFIADVQRHVCRSIVIGYGATEAGQVASAPLHVLDDTPGAVGCLHPGIDLQIVDDKDRPLPPGRSGAIRIRGEGSADGYLGEAKDAESVFRDGWFYPGDVGALTADGRLVVEGRTSELVINKGGFKVSPALIEDELRKEPAVLDAAVVAALSESGAPEIWAAVVIKGAIDAASLQKSFEGKLGAAAPDRVVKVDAIPRNEIGKIQYKDVRTRLGLPVG